MKRARVVLAVGTAQTLAWGSSYYLPAVLADPVSASLGVTRAWFFGAFSGSLVLMAVLGPAIGRRIDARGGRKVLIASAYALSAGLAALAAAQGPVTLACAWVLLGVAMSLGLYESAFAALTWLYGHGARSPITGITLMAGFASTIGWPATAAMEHAFGWRTACLVWAVLHLAVTLPCYALAMPRRAAHEEPTDGADPRAPPPYGEPPANAMLLLGVVFAIVAFVSTAMAAHLPRLLQATGTGVAASIAAAALVGPAQVAARFGEFVTAHRWQPHPVIAARVAAALHPAGAGLLIAVGGAGLAAPAFALLHGAGNGLLTIARGTLPLALFGPVGYGYRQGAIGAVARLAQAAAPIAFGVLLDAAGATAALAVSGGLSFAALVALLALRRRVRRS